MMRITEGALFLGASLLSAFLLFFGNSALLPLDLADCLFLLSLAFLFALYRPGWAFLLFLSVLPFETVNLAPSMLPFSLRPYQLAAGVILLSIVARLFFRRLPFSVMKFRWFDVAPILFGLGGVLSIGFASNPLNAAKQLVIVLSFISIYFLSRQFLRSKEDVRHAFPFLAIGFASTIAFALWQSREFLSGGNSFEVMPGRPNAYFSEPDWLGMFLILSGSVAISILFHSLRKCSRVSCPKMSEGVGKISVFPFGSFGRKWLWLSFGLLFLSWVGMLLTVARSAWIGLLASSALFPILLLLENFSWHPKSLRWRLSITGCLVVAAAFFSAVVFVKSFSLTTFDLAGRAGSSAGRQDITVACESDTALPDRIGDISELSQYGCRFIRLEEIDAARAAGEFVSTVSRPDPSIEARRTIIGKTLDTIKGNWLFGIGWGAIGDILGTDSRGAALNASNAFLESWLGGGVLGVVSFLVMWLSVPMLAIRRLFAGEGKDDRGMFRSISVFFLISWVGFTVFNCFNSGILMGFVWVWLGGIGMMAEPEE